MTLDPQAGEVAVRAGLDELRAAYATAGHGVELVESALGLQRALARAGVTSRRKAEDLIRAGRVRVDGAEATLGSSVDPERQRVTVDGRVVRPPGVAWIALNKPVGYVVSRGDPEGRRTGYDLL